MPPLISREEALELGALTDPKDIEMLVERAWRMRVERFHDSTDMCSLVNAKSGDRELMDPWEAVKWIAIFRLILPGALFRLCGGRTENLGELQPLAIKAGVNGVMMGNFLTTLGNAPEQDRAMFEELGLNVASQIRLWDPSTQLRFRAKHAVPPRPDGAPNAGLDAAA